MIGIAAVTLAMGLASNAVAQERIRATLLVNPAFPTGGSNVTLTNSQATYAPGTAVPVALNGLQTVPVWWVVTTTSAGAGTSNTVVGLDLSADGTYWSSNALTATIAQTGTGTNIALTYFPVNNGTNVFSGYQLARWSYASTAQLTNVTLLVNQLQAYR